MKTNGQAKSGMDRVQAGAIATVPRLRGYMVQGTRYMVQGARHKLECSDNSDTLGAHVPQGTRFRAQGAS